MATGAHVDHDPKQTEQLARMERAGQETSDPSAIKDEAHREEPTPSSLMDRKSLVWLASLAGGAIALAVIRALLATRLGPDVRRLDYLRAAALILAILTVAKAIEVFLIGRVA